MHLHLLKKLLSNNWIADRKMLKKANAVLLPHLVHNFLHQLLHPRWRLEEMIKNLLVILLHHNIINHGKLPLHKYNDHIHVRA